MLQTPPPDLSGFPIVTIAAAAALHRVTGWDVEAAAARSPMTAVGAFGMTKELTTADYSLAQTWATAFDTAGFDAIFYASRFDNRDGPHAVAIFGDAGVATLAYDESARGPDDVLGDYVELTSARLIYPPPARTLEHREP